VVSPSFPRPIVEEKTMLLSGGYIEQGSLYGMDTGKSGQDKFAVRNDEQRG